LARDVADPMRLYAHERSASLTELADRLGLPPGQLQPFVADPHDGLPPPARP